MKIYLLLVLLPFLLAACPLDPAGRKDVVCYHLGKVVYEKQNTFVRGNDSELRVGDDSGYDYIISETEDGSNISCIITDHPIANRKVSRITR